MKKSMYQIISFLVVSCLVLVFYVPSAHALASVDFAIKEICSYMEGSLGGLLMAAAGVGGIASAAFGNMKAMYSCLVTAIGAFGISSVLSLHFTEAAGKCNGGGGDANARVKSGLILNDTEVSKFNPENAAKSYISYSKNQEKEDSVASDTGATESDLTNESKVEEDADSDLDLF